MTDVREWILYLRAMRISQECGNSMRFESKKHKLVDGEGVSLAKAA
jgi:hypothetical protein